MLANRIRWWIDDIADDGDDDGGDDDGDDDDDEGEDNADTRASSIAATVPMPIVVPHTDSIPIKLLSAEMRCFPFSPLASLVPALCAL